MAKIVGAISMSHAPGATGWPDAPEPGMRNRLAAAHAEIASYLDAAKPDVIVAILDDHFENHYRNLMPTFAIGIADSHRGPADYFIPGLGLSKKEVIPGMPELGLALLEGLVTGGFDVARMGEVEYGNNLMTPLKLIRPEFDIPVLPIFINVFSPPLTPVPRAYAFGQTMRRQIEAYPANLRVALLATGGLSHWPPVWTEDAPEDDEFLRRMRRYQTEGRSVLLEDPEIWLDLKKYEIEMAAKNEFPLNCQHPIVNAQWDREIMDAFGRGDVAYVKDLTFDVIQAQGGHGGHEILNWIAVMGAMGGAPAHVVGYEPVIEWICGMGYLTYPVAA
jgi:2,3-dihydroxyphenylpropionate 1,2-dioxygenase